MGSSLKWTVPPLQGLTIRLCGNELSLESLYMPSCPRRILRQIEEKEEFSYKYHKKFFAIYLQNLSILTMHYRYSEELIIQKEFLICLSKKSSISCT